MEQNERQMIEGLFAKLQQAQQQSGPRDRDAERLIADALGGQPAAPYYMAQVILVQDHAMQAQHLRIEELEKELAARPAAATGGSSFLGGLFGGGMGQTVNAALPAAERTPAAPTGTSAPAPASRGWSNAPPAEERVPPGAQYAAAPPAGRGLFGGQAGGGGFMASALTTAAGVAGGMMAASALSSLFGGGQAHAAGLPGADAGADSTSAAPAESAAAQPRADDAQPDDGYADSGDQVAYNDDGADFDTFGDF